MLPAHRICIKNQYKNNNILGLDTSELRFGGVQMRVDTSEFRFGGVQKLVLKLETRTEQFKSYLIVLMSYTIALAISQMLSPITFLMWGNVDLQSIHRIFKMLIPCLEMGIKQTYSKTNLYNSPRRLRKKL